MFAAKVHAFRPRVVCPRSTALSYRAVDRSIDLWCWSVELTSRIHFPPPPPPPPQIRTELETQMVCDLREFKEFIDNEMIVILGQMDSPTRVFDHVYLVRTHHHRPPPPAGLIRRCSDGGGVSCIPAQSR